MSHRAAFNEWATIYRGAHGSPPLALRGSGQCRVVDQHFIFRDSPYPLSEATAYITLDFIAPQGPSVQLDGIEAVVDYAASDTISVAGTAVSRWVITEVEYLDVSPPYYRVTASMMHWFGVRAGVLLGGDVAIATPSPHLFDVQAGVYLGGAVAVLSGFPHLFDVQAGVALGGAVAVLHPAKIFAWQAGVLLGGDVAIATPSPHLFDVHCGVLLGGDVQLLSATVRNFQLQAGVLLGGDVSSATPSPHLFDVHCGVLLGGDVGIVSAGINIFGVSAGVLLGGDVLVEVPPAGFGEERWYKFLEGSGTLVADSVSGQNGTRVGGAWSTDSPTTGSSIYFSGAGGDKITIPHITYASTFTVFGRVKCPASSSGNIFTMICPSDAGKHGWYFAIRKSFGQVPRLTNSTGSSILGSFSPGDDWHWYAASVASDVVTLYADGTVVGTGTLTAESDDPTNDYQMGAWYNTFFVEGYLTDVRYWLTALDAATLALVGADTSL